MGSLTSLASQTSHTFRVLGRDFRSLEAAKAYLDGYNAGTSDALMRDPDWEVFVFSVWEGQVLSDIRKVKRWTFSEGWQEVRQ